MRMCYHMTPQNSERTRGPNPEMRLARRESQSVSGHAVDAPKITRQKSVHIRGMIKPWRNAIAARNFRR